MTDGFFAESTLHQLAGVSPADRERYVGLVGCGAAKLNRPAAARDLYRGGYTRAQMRWVGRNCRRWRILSAKYGVLDPGRVVAPYDLAVTALPETERIRWGARVSKQLAKEFGVDAAYLILAGAAYVNSLAVAGAVLWVWGQFAGPFPHGLRMRWLKQNPVLNEDCLAKIREGRP